jgi:hypothetical protein
MIEGVVKLGGADSAFVSVLGDVDRNFRKPDKDTSRSFAVPMASE